MTALIAALGLVRRFWPYAVGVSALLGASVWLDHRGYARGIAHVEARDARAAARIEAARVRLVARLDTLEGALAAARQRQDESFTEIRHAVAPIILRPIYRAACIDADGVGLLDRARAAADGDAAGEPAGGAGAAPGLPAQR